MDFINVHQKKPNSFHITSLLISLFVINYILSWSFNAPVGNLTQLLYGPFVFVIGAMIYFVLTELLSKIRYKKV